MLLDTSALIWLGFGDESLSLLAKQRIEESEIVYVSPVSLWEMVWRPANISRSDLE